LTDRRIDVAQFLALRFVRLWPMVGVGTALGVAVSLRLHDPVSLGAIAANLLLLPNVFAPAQRLFPYNAPHWSLWFELVATVGFAAIAPLLDRRALWAIIAVSAIGVAMATYARGNGDHFGPWRVTYSFALGVLLCRSHAGRRARFGTASAVLLALLLAATMALPRHWAPQIVDATLVLV